MREYDEAHVQRLLIAEVEKNGGNIFGTERALGLYHNAIYNVLRKGQPLPDAVARTVGFRRKYPGRLTRAHRPTKYIPLADDEESSDAVSTNRTVP